MAKHGDMNLIISGVVTFGETKPIHSQLMREHKWMLGEFVVDELFEYKDLGVLKSYVSSFALNVDDNIEKAQKRLARFFLPTLTVVKQTHSFMSSSVVKHVYPPCYLALNSLH